MTRERLEGLSFDELKRLADKERVLFPEDIEKDALIDLIQEILDELMQERCESNNPSIRVEELKYHISQDEELDIPDSDKFIIPSTYNKTRIVFMPRDPYWAFAYWEVEKTMLEELQENPEYGGIFLRVHDIKNISFDGGNSNYSFDIPVMESDLDWYINVPHPDSSYTLELYYTLNNADHLLARSNSITTPRDSIAEVSDKSMDEGIETDRLIELTHQELFRLPSSWGPIPQRIISFVNLKYLRQND